MRIVIEGNISSGKSSLAKYLQRKIDKDDLCINDSGQIYFNKDPRYNIIQLASTNPKKWSFLLQLNFLFFFKTREREDLKKFTITSRSSLSVMNVFSKAYLEQGYISLSEYEYLQKINRMYTNNACDVLIFITSSNNVARCSSSFMKNNLLLYSKYYEKQLFLDSIRSENFAKKIIILDGDISLEYLESESIKERNVQHTNLNGLDIYEARSYKEVFEILMSSRDPSFG